jgi:hypothetical protein
MTVSTATAQNPDVKVLWSHTQNNIQLRLLDIDYGYHIHGISALVVKLEIVNTDNDDQTSYYFESGIPAYYAQYFQQYVNGGIRAKQEFETNGFVKWFGNLFKTKLEKDPNQFRHLELMTQASIIFGENYKY